MKSIKETTIEVLKHLPDSSSVEDIMYEINLMAQVLEGVKDDEKGNTLSTQQMLDRIQLWKRK